MPPSKRQASTRAATRDSRYYACKCAEYKEAIYWFLLVNYGYGKNGKRVDQLEVDKSVANLRAVSGFSFKGAQEMFSKKGLTGVELIGILAGIGILGSLTVYLIVEFSGGRM